MRALSYGGARTPVTVLQRTMRLLPDVDLTNAYGLTETSSTIAVLGPDDHRAARDGDPVAVARLASAGRVLPTVDVEVRGSDGTPSPPGEVGELWARGEQVSGEYAGQGRGHGHGHDAGGWFPTRDRGQRIVAAVVPRAGAALDPAGVRELARRSLRGSKTPDSVAVVAELPYTETGKLLRRAVREQLGGATVK